MIRCSRLDGKIAGSETHLVAEQVDESLWPVPVRPEARLDRRSGARCCLAVDERRVGPVRAAPGCAKSAICMRCSYLERRGQREEPYDRDRNADALVNFLLLFQQSGVLLDAAHELVVRLVEHARRELLERGGFLLLRSETSDHKG